MKKLLKWMFQEDEYNNVKYLWLTLLVSFLIVIILH